MQWDTGARTLQNNYVLGSATYDTSAGINVTGQWDVYGTAYYLNIDPMPGTCSAGVYTVSGQSSADLNGTVTSPLMGRESSRPRWVMRLFSFPNTR